MYHINTILVKDSDTGQHGNLFGGRLLYVLDESAASFAMQVCDTSRVVTVSMDKCEFKLPARKGSLVKLFGEVDRIGTTSITLRMEARKHNVYTGTQKVILETKITFVRVDPDGQPIPIAERVHQKYKEIKNKIK